MLNLALLNYLPYDIKFLLYISVKNYYNKRKKTGFCKVIDIINNSTNIIESLRPIIQDIEPDYYNLYNYRFLDEKNSLLNVVKYEIYLKKKMIKSNFLIRKIIFDCKKIKEIYGDLIHVYYWCLQRGKWCKFLHPLPYGMSLPIRNFNRYNSILISHLPDLYDEDMDPKERIAAWQNPIFKFKFHNLLSEHFRFSDKNKYHHSFLLDELYTINFNRYNSIID